MRPCVQIEVNSLDSVTSSARCVAVRPFLVVSILMLASERYSEAILLRFAAAGMNQQVSNP